MIRHVRFHMLSLGMQTELYPFWLKFVLSLVSTRALPIPLAIHKFYSRRYSVLEGTHSEGEGEQGKKRNGEG